MKLRLDYDYVKQKTTTPIFVHKPDFYVGRIKKKKNTARYCKTSLYGMRNNSNENNGLNNSGAHIQSHSDTQLVLCV